MCKEKENTIATLSTVIIRLWLDESNNERRMRLTRIIKMEKGWTVFLKQSKKEVGFGIVQFAKIIENINRKDFRGITIDNENK